MERIGVTDVETSEIRDEGIDVEEIMRRIRENIRKRKEAGAYPEEMNQTPGDVSCCAEDLQRDLDYINSNWDIENNSYYISSHRRVTGKFLVTGRELVHGEVRRYVDPVIVKQKEFNGSTVRILNEITRKIDEIVQKMTKPEERVGLVRAEIDEEVANRIEDTQLILLDYPIRPTPRYGYGKPPHPKLYEIISRNRNTYKNALKRFLRFKEYFLKIPLRNANNSQEPCWINEWLPGLDSIALYSILCLNNPKRYFEIGSGYSTKFARKAILDHNLRTKITSIDPHPRDEIDSICDAVIRQPLEDADLSVFDELETGDILYVDGSHYCFMNSDATVVFLDILPRLRSGVFLEFHDIILPYDYPPEWEKRYYSEQYLLAAYILAEGNKFNIVLPNAFISKDPELSHILYPLWDNPEMGGVERHGGSFWIETK